MLLEDVAVSMNSGVLGWVPHNKSPAIRGLY